MEPGQRSSQRRRLQATGKPRVLPGPDGAWAGWWPASATRRGNHDPMIAGSCGMLPPGTYRFANDPPDPRVAALGWLLSGYRFTRYKKGGSAEAPPWSRRPVSMARVERIAAARWPGTSSTRPPTTSGRPRSRRPPARWRAHGATVTTRGATLLATNFPLIHAVGRAAPPAPRLIDFTWGTTDAPQASPWSARACPSTPAGSTSSPRAAWC